MKDFLFQGRVGMLATMHHKEKVIAPILEQKLGVQVVVPNHFDTDRFGTFTRDRARTGNQRQAARSKAEQVLELTHETLAIASEGTFLPYPSFPAIPSNHELVLLLDRANGIEVVGEAFSLETNYSHRTIKTVEQALEFAEKIGFPEHGLVVMLHPSSQQADEIVKGIVSEEKLIEVVGSMLKRSPSGTVHLETDMRALYNPTRMKVIEQATIDLVRTIQQACPQCNWPGFALMERRVGLPCGWCGLPTSLTHMAIYRCQKCEFQQEQWFPDGIETADPAQCAYCNP